MGTLVKFAGLAVILYAASQVLTFGGDPNVIRPPQPNDGLYLILVIGGVIAILVGAGMEDD